ncbi:MAG TPA: dihydrolipoamide acetyltransferase family protein [Steroidobacteraceae bacterium]|nr:dihydrolipoamide acetyltransferase family protein [Steroidobacteraceae bacterium]
MGIAVEIRAPAEQSEGTRSQVLRWLKSVGETVAENEPLIELETDKVTVEVASPGAGVLREILKGEQEEIAPGEVLGRLEKSVETSGVVSAPSPASPPSSSAASSSSTPVSSRPAPSSSDGASSGAGTGEPGTAAAGRLSPAVRRLLSENSLDPSTIRGSGQGGRITVEDVLAAIASRASSMGHAAEPAARAAAGAPAVATGGASAAAPAADVTGPSRRVPHTPVRKRIAEHMVQSLLHTAPHVTTVFEADMTAVLAHREKHREEFAKRGAPLTLTAYFLQAAVDAIRAVPEANSRWTDSALEIFESIHIGVGTALEEGGLVVPVLRDVQSRDLFETAAGLNDLVVRAREGKLTPADVRGGTFTISNHGVSGSLVATPIIINQPQAAILGVGKLEKRAVVIEEGGVERIVARPRCYVTLTLDHRVMDGHQANHFLRTFVARLTNWPA